MFCFCFCFCFFFCLLFFVFVFCFFLLAFALLLLLLCVCFAFALHLALYFGFAFFTLCSFLVRASAASVSSQSLWLVSAIFLLDDCFLCRGEHCFLSGPRFRRPASPLGHSALAPLEVPRCGPCHQLLCIVCSIGGCCCGFGSLAALVRCSLASRDSLASNAFSIEWSFNPSLLQS